MDSNHRSNLQQIYSLSPLATRESAHSSVLTDCIFIPHYTLKCKYFFYLYMIRTIFPTTSLYLLFSRFFLQPFSRRINCLETLVGISFLFYPPQFITFPFWSGLFLLIIPTNYLNISSSRGAYQISPRPNYIIVFSVGFLVCFKAD